MKRSGASHMETDLRGRRAAVIRSLSKKMTPIAKVAPAQQRGAAAGQISRACAVLGCDDYKLMPNHLFFRFPEDASLRSVWTEMTGRAGWTPNDYSYMCVSHFTPDCLRRADARTVLEPGSVPTLKLPHHVMEVEYVDEDILDKEIIPKVKSDPEASESEPEAPPHAFPDSAPAARKSAESHKSDSTVKLELVKIFSEVQIQQKKAVGLSKRLRHDKQVLRLREQNLKRLKDKITQREKELATMRSEVRPKSPHEALDKDSILLMPTRYTEEAKNLALSIHNYSPEAYIYLRNTLRTMLPSAEVLDDWTRSGFKPRNVMSSADCLKIVTEAKENELYCKVSIL